MHIMLVLSLQLCVKLLPIIITKVTEATSSPAMETLGFRRGLDRLIQAGVGVDVITTDRSPSIRKLMRPTLTSSISLTLGMLRKVSFLLNAIRLC